MAPVARRCVSACSRVVTEDGGEPLRQIGRLPLEPFGEPFMQTSTVLAGHALIRGEPDQHVTEPEPARADALDQAFALQSVQVALDERTRIIWKKRAYRVLLHVHAADRCT